MSRGSTSDVVCHVYRVVYIFGGAVRYPVAVPVMLCVMFTEWYTYLEEPSDILWQDH